MSLRLESPYLSPAFRASSDALWLRGNLHAHTIRTDGELSPEAVIAAYEALGYDFLAISDHDLLVPPAAFQDTTKMTLIAADEATANGPHLLCVHIRETVAPDADRQRVLDATGAQGGFTILNHPNWQRKYSHWTQEEMERLTGYAGIEIYNGVIERLEGSALATDRWDRLLATGRRVWGFAHDDSHRRNDIGRGWIAARAEDRGVDVLADALRHGRFYASTGVSITRIAVEDTVFHVAAPDAGRIVFRGAWGRELQVVDGAEARYEITGDENGYVRAECHGNGGRAAWTQPVFVSNAT